jgi:hypothetical protein
MTARAGLVDIAIAAAAAAASAHVERIFEVDRIYFSSEQPK